jgi:CMP-N-acetylneuraminic acid synthetase
MGYEMPPERAIDIDNAVDLHIARSLLHYSGQVGT